MYSAGTSSRLVRSPPAPKMTMAHGAGRFDDCLGGALRIWPLRCGAGRLASGELGADGLGSVMPDNEVDPFAVGYTVVQDGGCSGWYQAGLRFSLKAVVPSCPSAEARWVQPSCASVAICRSSSNSPLAPRKLRLVMAIAAGLPRKIASSTRVKFRFHFVLRDDLMDQADAFGFSRVELLAGQGVAAGMTQADGIDHVGGDRSGGDAHANFGDAELRVRGREGDIDAADDADAATEAGAVHQRDGRSRKLVEQLHCARGREEAA